MTKKTKQFPVSEPYHGPHVILDREEVEYLRRYTESARDEIGKRIESKFNVMLKSSPRFIKPHE